MRLRQIVQLVLRAAQRPGRDRMQQWFPDMGAAAVDQRDADIARVLVLVAERGGEFEPAGAAALAALAGCAGLDSLPRPVTTQERLNMIPAVGLPVQRPVTIYWSKEQIPFIEAETDRDAAIAVTRSVQAPSGAIYVAIGAALLCGPQILSRTFRELAHRAGTNGVRIGGSEKPLRKPCEFVFRPWFE